MDVIGSGLIPPFDAGRVFVAPWTTHADSYGWIALMGFLVACSCGWVGNFLILRRMALVGDAISHSILPGLAIAFLLSHQRSSWVMFLGATVAGVVTTFLIEIIHRHSRVKQDAAIGIAFSSLFAVGVVLINLYASRVDLDQDCVLYGEIAFVTPSLQPATTFLGLSLGPAPVVRMAAVALVTGLLILGFYRPLLVSSFDPGLAHTLGIPTTWVHYGLMGWLSIVVVSAFESVGAILVIAMLILPGATGLMLTDRLPTVFAWTVAVALVSSIGGVHLALWLDCSVAGAMVVAASAAFGLAWVFSPSKGLLRRWLGPRVDGAPPTEPALE